MKNNIEIKITDQVRNEIISIWDAYIKNDKVVRDTKGNELKNIDQKRLESSEVLKQIIRQFLNSETNVSEFKTAIDSYNKRNNLWGFTSIKGQMFFNQIVKNNEENLELLESLLKDVITAPENLNEALEKIEKLESFTYEQYESADNRRKFANPSSTGYYLSYFWQISEPHKWPIMYTSMIRSFQELGIWEEHQDQKGEFEYFYHLNEKIKEILKKYTNKTISNWDTEHALWNYKGSPHTSHSIVEKKEKPIETGEKNEVSLQASFDLNEYLIPKIADLIEVGNGIEKTSSRKGLDFENKVNEVFRLLDFDVEPLGQGSGRNPDGILRYRQENTAFLVDAKAYGDGYSLGIDNRAINEYINYYCPKLDKEGFKKIGFIIVSNSFKSDFDSFINEITWNTPIKRFVLITSEALLYLFAYKMKESLSVDMIIDKIISCGNKIEAKDIIDEFEDV